MAKGSLTRTEKQLVVHPFQLRRGMDARTAARILQRFRSDPYLFVTGVLGAHLWDKQRAIFEDVFRYPQVTVRACHASGKSYCAAVAVLTYVHLFFPCAVVTTAPTGRQVFSVIWREIRKVFNRSKVPLGGNPLQMSYTLFDDAYAMGVATDDPDKLQGIHSPNILVVVDEATGLPEEMFDAIEGLLASGRSRLLLLGNPSRVDGYFYRSFNDPALAKGFRKHAISAFDTPNVKEKREVIPGLITWEWVQRRREVWGESHPLYQIKVLGEFPSREFGNLVIPPHLIEEAKKLDEAVSDDPVILGVDVAEMGGDETAVAVRKGKFLLSVHAWAEADLRTSAARVVEIAHRTQAREVRVDRIGVGAGFFVMLQDMLGPKVRVVGVDMREAPTRPDKYHDLRSEYWYGFREMLQGGEVSLARYRDPEEDITLGQLMYPTYAPTSVGLIRVESKAEMRKRGLGSPDRAEAVILAFYDAYVCRSQATLPTPEQLKVFQKEPTLIARSEPLYAGEEPPWRERTNLREIVW